MWDDVLKRKFPQHKVNRGQIVLKDCPFCGNSNHNIEFSIEKGVGHCWICDWSGTVRRFFKEAGIPYEDDGMRVSGERSVPKEDELSVASFKVATWEKFGKFLSSRGLEPTDLSHYNILTTDRGKFREKIIFPLYEGSKLVYIIARDPVTKGRYYNLNISRSEILPYYLGRTDKTTAYLCEGVMDAIAINKLGYTSVPLLGTILSQAQIRKMDAFGFKTVVVCLDGDALDKTFKIFDMLERRGFDARISLFHKRDDPNSVFVRDRAELKHALKISKPASLVDRVRLKIK